MPIVITASFARMYDEFFLCKSHKRTKIHNLMIYTVIIIDASEIWIFLISYVIKAYFIHGVYNDQTNVKEKEKEIYSW